MSLAKWCAISSAVLIGGAAASWWIPTSIAGRPFAPARLAAQANDIRDIVPASDSRIVLMPQPSVQDEDAVRKLGLTMLRQALQAGVPNDGAFDVDAQRSIAWPTPPANGQRGDDTTDHPYEATDKPGATHTVSNDQSGRSVDNLGVPIAPSFESPSEVRRIKHIGHKVAAAIKPRKPPQDEAAAPKPHKTTPAEYIERVVEQGDAGALTYKEIRRRCEPGNMVDVCYMPAKNRRSIVIERY